MGKFTAEEIQIAKAVDLVDLAEQIGIPLKRKGRFYQAVGMDSVICLLYTSPLSYPVQHSRRGLHRDCISRWKKGRTGLYLY